VVLRDGTILNTFGTTKVAALVRNNAVPCNTGGQAAWVVIDSAQITGWQEPAGTVCAASDPRDPSNTCLIGSNAAQVKLNNVSNGLINFLKVK
jgi:hypothetical protein